MKIIDVQINSINGGSFAVTACKKKNHYSCFKKERNHKYADISCYSFYPSKNLGAYGDGGAIVTNNKTIAKKCKRIRIIS